MLRNNPYLKPDPDDSEIASIYRQVFTWIDPILCHQINFKGAYPSRTQFQGYRWQWGYLSDDLHAIVSEMICQQTRLMTSLKVDLLLDMRFLMCETNRKSQQEIRKNSRLLVQLLQVMEEWPVNERPGLWWMDSSQIGVKENFQDLHPDRLLQLVVLHISPLRSDTFFNDMSSLPAA